MQAGGLHNLDTQSLLQRRQVYVLTGLLLSLQGGPHTTRRSPCFYYRLFFRLFYSQIVSGRWAVQIIMTGGSGPRYSLLVEQPILL